MMIDYSVREEIRAILLDEIADLTASIGRLQERLAPVEPDTAIGRISRTDAMMNAGTVSVALRESQARLSRLRQSLARVDRSDFGVCQMCGQTIHIERLRVVPDATVCVPCMNNAAKR